MRRSDTRTQFLKDLLTTAIENGGYGFFEVEDYSPEHGTATIVEQNGEDEGGDRYDIDIETMAAGLGVIRDAVLVTIMEPHVGEVTVLHNVKSGQRLFMSEDMRARIGVASRENEAADLDCVDALAVLECALFGAVTYA